MQFFFFFEYMIFLKSAVWKMFCKEIKEQTEPGSAFLKYLEAQIVNIFPVNHGGLKVCTVLTLIDALKIHFQRFFTLN